MRAAFFSALVLTGAMACTSFGGDSPSVPVTPANDAGQSDSAVAAIADSGDPAMVDGASNDVFVPATSCAADPTAKTCFDFDTTSPDPGAKEVANGSLSLVADNAGGDALAATVDATLAGPATSHAYYHVPIDGTPGTVHWKLDLMLTGQTMRGMDFAQLSAGGPLPGGKCFLQPTLSGEASFSILESCGAPLKDHTVLTVPITKNVWWNIDITVDFTQTQVSVLLHTAGVAPESGNGTFLNATSKLGMEVELGIDFADPSMKGDAAEFDNFFLYY